MRFPWMLSAFFSMARLTVFTVLKYTRVYNVHNKMLKCTYVCLVVLLPVEIAIYMSADFLLSLWRGLFSRCFVAQPERRKMQINTKPWFAGKSLLLDNVQQNSVVLYSLYIFKCIFFSMFHGISVGNVKQGSMEKLIGAVNFHGTTDRFHSILSVSFSLG